MEHPEKPAHTPEGPDSKNLRDGIRPPSPHEILAFMQQRGESAPAPHLSGLPSQAALTCGVSSEVRIFGWITLSLTWSPADHPDSNDWVGLWDHEPVKTDDYLEYRWACYHPDGYGTTDVVFEPSKTYWAAYCRHSEILCKQRFMWHPHWMADLGEKIEAKKLRELVLPASHDSATYGIKADSDFSPDLPDKYRWKIAKAGIAAWAKTQAMNVAQQLDAGYRAFDLRVAKNVDGDFWIFHGMYSVKLTEVLDAVRAFSMRNPHEIVLLVLSLLKMSPEDPAALLKLLKDGLGKALAQNSLGRDATVQDFWTAHTPIAIIYNEIDKQYSPLPNPITDSILWNRSDTIVTDYSAENFNSADRAIDWIANNIILDPKTGQPRKYDRFWDLPLILTTDFWEVIKRPQGLAAWTSQTAVSPFTNFYEKQSRNLNAIAVDFVNFYPLVSWAIQKNGETQQPKTRQAAQGGLVR